MNLKQNSGQVGVGTTQPKPADGHCRTCGIELSPVTVIFYGEELTVYHCKACDKARHPLNDTSPVVRSAEWPTKPGPASGAAADSTGAASVDPSYHWLPVSADTPRGTKLQLIVRPDGVAQYGHYTPGSKWTHYALLPTFEAN